MRRRYSWIVLAVLGIAVAVGLVALGRASAGTGAGRASGYGAGYADGVRDGRAGGLQEGRALAQVQALPSGQGDAARASFDAGYVAGANDAFSGYDGGWSPGVPYVVTLVHPAGPIGYRIASRAEMAPGVTYYLCPDGHSLCHR
jgi:hypothetical protein